jgi:hypothetical protein
LTTGSPTPCAEWNLRELLNHVVAGNWWAARLASGATIAQVGTELDGDQLGDAARRLERAGAEAILICANTMHKVADAVAVEHAAESFDARLEARARAIGPAATRGSRLVARRMAGTARPSVLGVNFSTVAKGCGSISSSCSQSR